MSPAGFTRRDALTRIAGGILLPLLKPSLASAKTDLPSSIDVDDPIHFVSLAGVAVLIEAGKILPTDVARQMLDRIGVVDPSLQSYVSVTADHAMHSALRAEDEIRSGRYRGPLHGVPIAVKDLCHMRGGCGLSTAS